MQSKELRVTGNKCHSSAIENPEKYAGLSKEFLRITEMQPLMSLKCENN